MVLWWDIVKSQGGCRTAEQITERLLYHPVLRARWEVVVTGAKEERAVWRAPLQQVDLPAGEGFSQPGVKRKRGN